MATKRGLQRTDPQSVLRAFRSQRSAIKAQKERALQAIGKKIKEQRLKAKLNQTEFADIIGKNRTSISNLEAGRQTLSITSVILLAHALGIEPGDLMPTMEEVLGK